MRIPPRGNALSQTNLDDHGDAIRDLAKGATNAGGDLTLTPSATSTTVQDRLCTANTMVMLSPRTADAAAMQVWTVSTQNGSFTLGHAASASTDLNFHYELRRR
ncbi:MAG: hypothetical protein INR70_02175 [Parafilimonas terrae]|nr:hypothetical protein [Parafilimonas terrae]